jgi:hypothetical protein
MVRQDSFLCKPSAGRLSRAVPQTSRSALDDDKHERIFSSEIFLGGNCSVLFITLKKIFPQIH